MSDWNRYDYAKEIGILGGIRYGQGFSKHYWKIELNHTVLSDEEVTIEIMRRGELDPAKIWYSEEYYLADDWYGPTIKAWIAGWHKKKKETGRWQGMFRNGKWQKTFPNKMEATFTDDLPIFPNFGETDIRDSCKRLRKIRENSWEIRGLKCE